MTTKRERRFEEEKILSLLWKLQRGEADKVEILDFIDEAVMDGVREFAKEIQPKGQGTFRDDYRRRIDDLLKKFEESEK